MIFVFIKTFLAFLIIYEFILYYDLKRIIYSHEDFFYNLNIHLNIRILSFNISDI